MMFVCHKNNYIKRLKLLGDKNEVLTDLTFWTNPHGKWITQDIPDDHEIIGLYANVSNCNFICRLGFILWKQKITYERGILKDNTSSPIKFK